MCVQLSAATRGLQATAVGDTQPFSKSTVLGGLGRRGCVWIYHPVHALGLGGRGSRGSAKATWGVHDCICVLPQAEYKEEVPGSLKGVYASISAALRGTLQGIVKTRHEASRPWEARVVAALHAMGAATQAQALERHLYKAGKREQQCGLASNQFSFLLVEFVGMSPWM